MKLRDNKWGFDLSLDNPFRVFRVLRYIADQSVGIENVVDLSRGDPGYGFSPSLKGREFFAFLVEIDVLLNNLVEHFVSDNREDYETIRNRIDKHAKKVFSVEKAEELLNDFDFFVNKIVELASKQGIDWSKRDIIFEIFKYSTTCGGTYCDPYGEILTRIVVADHYNEVLNLGIDYKDLIFLQGVSHGIGTIFKVLNDEAIGYLQKGDYVMMNSPTYAPYNRIIENRGLKTYSLPVNPINGEVSGDIDEFLKNAPKNLKLICLIDPNNPIGFMNNKEYLEKIAQFAKERDILIISDEVYNDFFPRKFSIMHFARERTILIGGRSKIERSTGLRFGEYIIAKEGQKYIGENLLKGNFDTAPDFMSLLIFAKAPGGIKGEFQHVAFVAGPSQYLGICHIIFGGDDRKEYLRRIKVNMENFYKILGMPYLENLYYTCFDLLDIPGNNKHGIEPEELFVGLAKKGVVLMPANMFFCEEDRKAKDYRTYARGSLPNVTIPNLEKGAHLMREYMTS